MAHAVGTAGNGALPGGAPFLWRNGGKSTRGSAPRPRRGKEFLFPGPFFSRLGWKQRFSSIGLPGLRPPRPTPHGPPTSSGGREKWSVDGRRKWETKRLLSAFSQRAPTHVPSPPSRWAGRYGPFTVRAAGQVPRKKYSLPHTTPPEKGVPGEEVPPPGVLSPISFQEMGPRLGKPKFPAVPTA